MTPIRQARKIQPARQQGFTLLELMVVVSILALVAGVVVTNYGAMVPSSRLSASAQEVRSVLERISSEASLQGKSITVELDLDRHRFRTVFPPEERFSLDDPEPEAWQLEWISLEDGVKFKGYNSLGGPLLSSGLIPIVFDQNGFSADQVVILTLEGHDNLVTTIQLRGLDRTTQVVTSVEGEDALLPITEEGAFL